MLNERRQLVLRLGGINGLERVRDVTLLCDECYATRASGTADSVKFERGAHDESEDYLEAAAIRATPNDSYIRV